MAQVTVPPVGDLVSGLPLPPTQRVALHDQVVDATSSRSRSNRWLRPTADLAASLLAVVIATRGGATVQREVLAAVALSWPLFLAVNGWFTRRPLGEPAGSHAGRVLRSGAGLGVACWLASAVVGEAAAPQALVPVVAALTLAVLVSGLVRLPGSTTRVVLAGHPDDVRAAVAELAHSPRFVVSAACLSAAPDEPLAELPVRVGVSYAADVTVQTGSDALLVLPGPGITHATMRRLQWHAHGAAVPFYIGTGLLDVAPTRVSVVQGAGLDVMQIRPAASHGPRRLAKEVVERLLAAVALLVLAPVLALVWLLVRRETPGPGLFRQQRVGRDGAEFTMLKFRTMSCTATEERAGLSDLNQVDGGVLFKLRSDPRVTRLGTILRRYSIDELPQLWNVVTGEMSLVGPRPALPSEVELYDLDPRRRLAVKPGLTGLWQVSGRSDLSWAESVRLDVKYVDNWSLALDLSILLRTVRAVLDHRGAY
ncbi:exopolysaccharide biosynthesis polyprenyl glycosylphosphotransferase [Nocardioides sp. CF8]|uniref:exopolysaccharide biosynthesis polyprenyl glycosylphosphotransferase n=1 Tax=Nocardioides sp. CF8 TaxID=110319 RepID=UPI00041F52C9|nr:exopolysaccharide biosynthesis polyprenyl glycosylphosphotransferase [Nocardioides sp. CF8]